MTVTHVIFDFFGTLVDYSPSRTEQGFRRSFGLLQSAGSQLDYDAFLALWSEVSGEFDRAAERSCREFSMVELGSAFLERVIDAPTERIVHEFVHTYVSEWNKGVRYLDGLSEMLERLSLRFTLALITNTHDRELVPRHLECMGVAGLFGHVVTSVEFGKRKPAPEIFEHALRLLQIDAERCVYVGDNYEADYVGARSVDIRALLVDPLGQAPIASSDRIESILRLEPVLDHCSIGADETDLGRGDNP